MEQVRIGVAAAAAEEPGPAVTAFFLVQHMGFAEIPGQLLILHPIEYIPQLVFFPAYKLMAGIEIAVFRDGEILMARAAARKALRDAGAV